MSAIGGILRLDGQVVSQAELERMQQALRMHGPDRQKIWQSGPVGLISGLMRFTPEDSLERQPLIDRDQGLVMVFEGRVDGRADLARTLGIESSRLKLMPDSALMLNAYLRWGVQAFTRVYGEFTLAIWHVPSQKLLLVRDPLGYHRSVFYTRVANLFAFATSIPALQTLPEVPRAINEEKLADFLVLNHSELNTTINKDIYRLPPAQFLQIDFTKREPEIKTYWDFDSSKSIRYRSDGEYVEHFNEIFERAVTDGMRSSYQVGAFMSGGIDSAAVASTAARLLKQQGKILPTYTAIPQPGFSGPRPPGRYNDESSLVNAIASMHDNLQTNFIDSADRTPLDGLDHYFMCQSAPFRNPCNRVWIESIMKTAAANGQRVILTGQHGNMTISYEGSYSLPQWLLRGHWLRLCHGLHHLHGYRDQSWLRWLKRWGVIPAMPENMYRWYRQMRTHRKHPWSSNSSIRTDFAIEHQVEARAKAAGFDMAYRLPINSVKARYEVLRGIDFGGDIHAGWRAAFGTDLRDPTGDRRIMEFCLAIPDEQYLNKKGMRWLAQRAFADRLPAEVLNNRLRGAQDPGWYLRLQPIKEDLRAEVERLERSDLAQRALDLPRLKRLMENWPSEDADWNDPKIQGLYRLCLERGIMVGRYIRWFEGENR